MKTGIADPITTKSVEIDGQSTSDTIARATNGKERIAENMVMRSVRANVDSKLAALRNETFPAACHGKAD
jgi:hypothetical protein